MSEKPVNRRNFKNKDLNFCVSDLQHSKLRKSTISNFEEVKTSKNGNFKNWVLKVLKEPAIIHKHLNLLYLYQPKLSVSK
jgi:hypothetical protein